ncbi:MAG: hypothetical protein ACLFSG_06125 [Halothiobacillaceae bacterium]
MSDTILPRGESLRRALAWLAERQRHDPQAIDEAARRFDLSALEEEFLIRQWEASRGGRPAHGDSEPD